MLVTHCGFLFSKLCCQCGIARAQKSGKLLAALHPSAKLFSLIAIVGDKNSALCCPKASLLGKIDVDCCHPLATAPHAHSFCGLLRPVDGSTTALKSHENRLTELSHGIQARWLTRSQPRAFFLLLALWEMYGVMGDQGGL